MAMIRMEITEQTPMVFVLETYPQTFPLFQRIGVCCVCDENMNSTVGDVCAANGEDAGLFIKTLKASLGLV